MTDEANSLVIEAASDPQGLSYTPDAPEPKVPAEPKPMSSREALEKAAADIEAKGGKIGDKDTDEPEAPKEAKEVKPRAENGKFAPKAEDSKVVAEDKTQEPPEAKADGDEGTGQENSEPKDRSSEDRDIDKPPAQFLPRAKEKWAEADADIRSEVRRMETEFQKGKEVFQEDRTFRKDLREFEEMAKGHGTTVKAALQNYVAIDNLLKSNPVEGINRVLQSIGITPQQYAQHVMNAPQQATADPKISQLEQQLQQVTQQLQQVTQTTQQRSQQEQYAEIDRTLFNEVRAEHPRFDDLREDIAFFFNSDKLSSITDERQRLFAATDMAERINPGYAQPNTERLKTAQADRPLNPAGAKSIKGAPNGTSVPKGANLNSRDAIEAAMRQIGL